MKAHEDTGRCRALAAGAGAVLQNEGQPKRK
jgi:hypothetical protein